MFTVLNFQLWSISLGIVITFQLASRSHRFIIEVIEAVRWLFTGPQLIGKRYLAGIPFNIRTPRRLYHLLSSREHIEEISRADENHLSLVAIAEEVFQPHHTMNGIELNRLGLQRRILRTMSLRLSSYQESLQSIIAASLLREFRIKDQALHHWGKVRIFALTQKVVSMANTYTFYGDQFTNDETFVEAAIQYPRDVFIASEVLRCVPSVFAGPTAWLVTRGHRASTQLSTKLLPVIEKRLKENECRDHSKPKDYVQHVIDLYPADVPNRAQRIVEQTLALWFASVHQPAITLYYAILDLCEHPGLQESLSQEVKTNQEPNGTVNVNNLNLLDSFLKESARMNTSESISLRRKALRTFTFKDGTQVGPGDWVCVPQRPIFRDASLYPNPDTFDPSRFLPQGSENGSKLRARFTDLDPVYPIWGLGKQACPGRFYASFIVKLVLIEMIQNYDFRMESIPACRYFSWRSSLIPRPKLEVEIRRKS